MTKTIIAENQIGLLVRGGRVVEILESGGYRTYGFRNESIVLYPTFEQTCAYAAFVKTKDAATLTVEASIGVTVVDAKRLYVSGAVLYEVVRLAVTQQLQAFAADKTLSELLEIALSVDEKALDAAIEPYGLQARVALEPMARLPRNLQNAIDAQEVARQRAKAELEEARGRSAVIRHYANVAKVTKDNPDLLRLLLGQKAKSINVAFDAVGKASQ